MRKRSSSSSEVEVRLLGPISRVGPIKVKAGTKIRELIELLREKLDIDIGYGELASSLLILINGKHISVLSGENTEIAEGDEVVVIQVAHGI